MATSHADLVMHPVRMRLLATLARRQLTARQLSELLPDVPQATLYHHLGVLTRAGLLRIVSERRVRGTVEKLYGLANDTAFLGPSELANASRDDHLRYFTIFVATLLADFARYLQQDAPIDPLTDGVGYRETPFYLSDEEYAQAAAAVSQALLPYLNNQPAPHRRRRLVAMIVLPDVDSSEDTHDEAGPAPTTRQE
ncbi:MAG TPA: helix-turn-helix domain-containing protein [Ktedonobacterales bacterium]|nr:helix-turn-helix domain-containing protein [Ktedonobacterales bacterium]